MKRLFLIFVTILSSACSTSHKNVIALPTILNIEGKDFVSAGAFDEYQINISKPEGGKFIVEIPELQQAPNHFVCGGVYWNGLTQGTKILEEAELVLDLKGVKEVWVPIEGKPKKLYVFEVR